MIRGTLGRYFATVFLKWIIGVFLSCLILIFLSDFVELLRMASDLADAPVPRLIAVSLYRLPSLGEQLLPFAVLFGSMAALLTLSRKSELVVTRAVGVSVWQFLAPGLAVTLGVGIASVLFYNPAAALLKERSDALEGQLFRRAVAERKSLWLRQSGEGVQSVLHAARAVEQGATLFNVTVYVFDRAGRFEERLEAREARLEAGRWQLLDGWRLRPGEKGTERFAETRVPTALTAEQVREILASPKNISFWDLPTYIALAEEAGLPAAQYRLQRQVLLARPLLLAAMVIIAATVSLRLFRLGNIGRMILGGVAAGFVLYVIGKLTQDFGGAGLVSPAAAAWVPASVALLLGTTILLRQEDG